jgi:fatty acid desaturase
MLSGLWFALGILIFALCAGAVISFVIFVPLFIYIIPYYWWIACQHSIGKHKDKDGEKLLRSVRNATILYKSWITKKEPTF